MGYYFKLFFVDQIGSNVIIKKEHHENVVQAIKDLHKTVNRDARGGNSSGDRWYSFTDYDFHKYDTIDEILRAWRYRPEFNDEGDIINLIFTGEKLGQCEIMFKAIARFVEDGSYINFQGEDGDRMEYSFHDKQLDFEWVC
jgi:hypothetical protein